MPSRLRTVKVLMREHARVSRVDRVATRTFELENPRTVVVYKIPALGNGKIQTKHYINPASTPRDHAIFPGTNGCPALNPPSTAHACPLT